MTTNTQAGPRRTKRPKLSDLLLESASPAAKEPAAGGGAEPPAEPESKPSSKPSQGRPREPKASAPVPARGSEVGEPKYLTLTRKEARLTEAQFDQLTVLQRQLNRRRGSGRGERITENTLIRVAIDLLLEKHSAALSGATEEELRRSVGLP